jgi:hypothetical protein
MNFLVKAQAVTVTETKLSVDLTDGRTIIVPLTWFPRLVHGTAEERAHWRWIAQGSGIHWPDLDEDISVKHLLEGKPSGESETSLQRWREARQGQNKEEIKHP